MIAVVQAASHLVTSWGELCATRFDGVLCARHKPSEAAPLTAELVAGLAGDVAVGGGQAGGVELTAVWG
jgi:hypothetical protein